MLSEVLLELLPLPPAPPAPPAPCAEPLALVWVVLVALEEVVLPSLVDAVAVDEFEEVVKRRIHVADGRDAGHRKAPDRDGYPAWRPSRGNL